MAGDGDGREEMVHYRRQGIPEDGGENLEGEKVESFSGELKERTFLSCQGVPDKMRGTVWRILLNVDQVKLKQQGIFDEMK